MSAAITLILILEQPAQVVVPVDALPDGVFRLPARDRTFALSERERLYALPLRSHVFQLPQRPM
ncbi:MAG TPA: hypothetical protein VFX03_03030 [Thermomicrobiales bacterium]|nr:hypothetical protein [Thermomicrobiales bacterium]